MSTWRRLPCRGASGTDVGRLRRLKRPSLRRRGGPRHRCPSQVLTSHGSPDGLAVTAGRRSTTLTPSKLTEVLDRTGVRDKLVIISACYSGVFIPRLATADTLVITAADANHPSFGCEDRAKWTYLATLFSMWRCARVPTLRDALT